MARSGPATTLVRRPAPVFRSFCAFAPQREMDLSPAEPRRRREGRRMDQSLNSIGVRCFLRGDVWVWRGDGGCPRGLVRRPATGCAGNPSWRSGNRRRRTAKNAGKRREWTLWEMATEGAKGTEVKRRPEGIEGLWRDKRSGGDRPQYQCSYRTRNRRPLLGFASRYGARDVRRVYWESFGGREVDLEDSLYLVIDAQKMHFKAFLRHANRGAVLCK